MLPTTPPVTAFGENAAFTMTAIALGTAVILPIIKMAANAK